MEYKWYSKSIVRDSPVKCWYAVAPDSHFTGKKKAVD